MTTDDEALALRVTVIAGECCADDFKVICSGRQVRTFAQKLAAC
jgi:hypothetical protein